MNRKLALKIKKERYEIYVRNNMKVSPEEILKKLCKKYGVTVKDYRKTLDEQVFSREMRIRIPYIIRESLFIFARKLKKDKENSLIVVKKIAKFFRIEINELKKYVIQKVEGR